MNWMIQLSSIGTFCCVVLAAWFAADLVRMIDEAWTRALEVDRQAYHILHGPNDGCQECEDK